MTRSPTGLLFPRPLPSFYAGAGSKVDFRNGVFARTDPAGAFAPAPEVSPSVAAIRARAIGGLGRAIAAESEDGRGAN